jgi:hypothetical protein
MENLLNGIKLEEAMKKPVLFAAIVFMGLAIALAGCSKDKKVNSAKTEGNYQDPTYLEAKNFAQNYIDSMVTGMTEGFNLMSFNDTIPLKVLPDTTAPVFDSTNSWWFINVHTQNGETTVLFSDSIRFERGDTFSYLPDTLTTTGIENRVKANSNIIYDTSSYSSDFARNVHLTGIQSQQVTVNVGSTANVGFVYPNRSYSQNYVGNLTNIVFNKVDLENQLQPHPDSGSMGLAMTVSAIAPDGSAIVNWVITITFRPDGYDAHAESGNNFWNWRFTNPE